MNKRAPEIDRCLWSLRELVQYFRRDAIIIFYTRCLDFPRPCCANTWHELKLSIVESCSSHMRNFTCRTTWSHDRWRCSTARFDLRLRTSLQQQRLATRRRRRRSRRQPSRNPCPRRRHRHPIPCCRLSRRPCPLNRHPGTPSRTRNSICS